MARCMDEIDLVLISDYNKGVCKGDMIPRLVKLARAAGVPVIADPVRDADYHRYAGCACITPNRTRGGPGRRHADHHAAGRPGGGAAAARFRRRVGAGDAGPRRHGLGRRVGQGPAVPRPAAAGVRHHRRRRHGAGRPGLHDRRGGRLSHGHRNRQHGRRPGGRAAGRGAADAAGNPGRAVRTAFPPPRAEHKIVSIEQLEEPVAAAAARPGSGSS